MSNWIGLIRFCAILASLAPRLCKPASKVEFEALAAAPQQRHATGELTVHGFGSSFRDWCAEATSCPRELAEVALAHAIGDKTEAAYRRGDVFDPRRALMSEWATFLDRAPAEVLALRAG